MARFHFHPMKKRRQKDVPHDVIEIILLRLPVKSLVRFKSVSKSWEATISDPEFAATYLRQSKKKKNNSSDEDQNLLLWVGKNNIDPQVFKFGSSNSDPEERPSRVLCYCDDGLVLVQRYLRNHEEKNKYIYVLWNPSTRSYRNISSHPQICNHVDYYGVALGLYYDPLIKDYKIVVTDLINRYSIYQMRKNSWSHETKETEIDIRGRVIWCDKGSSFEGDIYWVVITRRREAFEVRNEVFLVCFDSKEEKFKKMPVPISGDIDSKFYLTYLGAHLCLAHYRSYMDWVDPRINQLWFVKRVVGGRGGGDGDGDGGGGGSWVEFKEAMPFSRKYIKPIRLTNENEIALDEGWRKSYTMYKYNVTTETCAGIQVTPNSGYPHSPLYLENMFYSSTPYEKTKSTS